MNHTEVNIRWTIRKDMPKIIQIEKNSFKHYWNIEDFIICLRQRNCISMVAEAKNITVGFMVYELEKTNLHILNFAVAPEYRKHNIGTQMINKLTNKLHHQRRQTITIEIRETNLNGQLFFKKNNFKAIEIIRNCYDDTEEDAYTMIYYLTPPNKITTNRISKYNFK